MTRIYTAEEVVKWAVHEAGVLIAEEEYVFRYFGERYTSADAVKNPWRSRPSFSCPACFFEWDLTSKIKVLEKKEET